MSKRLVTFFILLVSLVFLSGCATSRKQKDLEAQGLRNQISVLEAEIQSKDDEISSLRDLLSRTVEMKEGLTRRAGKVKVIAETKSRPNTKQIQIALLNAGYNPGRIDGRMGRQTKDAIKAFQRANNLAADGKVGRETWELLSRYLDKRVK